MQFVRTGSVAALLVMNEPRMESGTLVYLNEWRAMKEVCLNSQAKTALDNADRASGSDQHSANLFLNQRV